MDKDAIERVQSLVLAAFQKDLNTHTPVIIVPQPNGAAGVMSLEQYMEGRSRFRGCMRTSLLSDFASYINERAKVYEGGAKFSAFIDADDFSKMSCKAFFNMGTEEAPGHCDDTAVLGLKFTATYAALDALTKQHGMSQRMLIDYIEDWNTVLYAEDDNGERMTAAQAIAGIRNMKIAMNGENTSTVGDTSLKRTAMEMVEVKAVDRLPVRLFVKTEPFAGFKSRDIGMRIAFHTSSKDPTFTLRVIAFEKMAEEVAQEFKEKVDKLVGVDMKMLVVGSFNAGGGRNE